MSAVRPFTRRSRASVDRLDVLLFHGLDRHEAHGRAGHGLTDRLCVVAVVLVAAHVGFDELGPISLTVCP